MSKNSENASTLASFFLTDLKQYVLPFVAAPSPKAISSKDEMFLSSETPRDLLVSENSENVPVSENSSVTEVFTEDPLIHSHSKGHHGVVFNSLAEIPASIVNKIIRVGVIPFCHAPPVYHALCESEVEMQPRFLESEIEHRSLSTESEMRQRFPESEMRQRFTEKLPFTRLISSKPIFDPSSERLIIPPPPPYLLKENLENAQLAFSTDKSVNIWFALGVDARFGELTDCGGFRGRLESIVDTAVRELQEESMGIFNFSSSAGRIKIQNSPAIVGEKSCIVFVEIDNPLNFGFPDKLPHAFMCSRSSFLNRRVAKSCLENSLMYWLSAEDLMGLATERRYRRLATRNKPSFLNPSKKSVPSWQTNTREALRLLIEAEKNKNSRTFDLRNGEDCFFASSILNEPDSPELYKHPYLYDNIKCLLKWNLGRVVELLVSEPRF